MDLKKYSFLREKIKNKDFEGKNKKIDLWLYIISYIGNIGSIFFAFFLVYPAFYKSVSANFIEGDIAIYLAGGATIIVLGIFELIKRYVLSNISFDFVKEQYKISKGIVGWVVVGLLLIFASFYFSLNGAIDFASTTKTENITITHTYEKEIDSIKLIYDKKMEPFLNDNASLREANTELRNRISETPLNYRTVRSDYQKLIDANIGAIEDNEERIKKYETEVSSLVDQIKLEGENKKNENNDSDFENILLFLIISSSIEIFIIVGVYFREYYTLHVLMLHQNKLEPVYRKRDRYRTLLKFLFKEGMVGQDEKIMGVSKLKELISSKSKIPNTNKFVDDFINDMTYVGVLKLVGNRRYTAVDYNEALKRVDKFDDTLRLLENLN